MAAENSDSCALMALICDFLLLTSKHGVLVVEVMVQTCENACVVVIGSVVYCELDDCDDR